MNQRIRDWLHERAIQRLARELAAAMQGHHWNAAAELQKRFQEAHAQRSPEQVARMEQRMGLRTRTTIKRGLMRAFLRGLVPAWVVRLAFRVFGLRSA